MVPVVDSAAATVTCADWVFRMTLLGLMVSKLPFRCHGNWTAVRSGTWPRQALCQSWPAGGILYNDAALARSVAVLHLLMVVQFGFANGRGAAAQRAHGRRLLVTWDKEPAQDLFKMSGQLFTKEKQAQSWVGFKCATSTRSWTISI